MSRVDWPALLAEAKDLAFQVAPHELRGLSLTLARESDLGFRNENALAWTSPAADQLVREALGTRDAERGPAIIFNDATIESGEDGFDGVRETTLAALLHETAHIVEQGWADAFRRHDAAGLRPAVVAIAVRHLRREPTSDSPLICDERDGFRFHSDRWIRVALHLRYRAWRLAGLAVPACAVFGRLPFHSAAIDYQRALGHEPARLVGCTLEEILATPLPPDFEALWQKDVQDYHAKGVATHA